MKNYHVIDQLSAYLDNELPNSERRIVMSHLESCESCQGVYEDLSLLSESVRKEWSSVEASDLLVDRILQQIDQTEAIVKRQQTLVGCLLAAFTAATALVLWMFSNWAVVESKFFYLLIHMTYRSMSVLTALVAGYPVFLVEMILIGTAIIGVGIWGLTKMLRNFAFSG